MKKIKEAKGITLVALVITVIVMLILAGVTINMTLGERGIFNTAASTKEKQEIAEYLEKIELSRVEVASKNMGKVTLDNLIDQIVEDKIVTRERITKINVDGEEKAKMITKEGYNFIITADKAEYAGKGDVIPTPPTLQEGDIQVTLTPTTWTNDKVTVEIKTKVEGSYTIQYSLDEGTTWKDYTTTFDVSENKTICACLRNALGEKGNYTTFKVDKIDKLAPVQFTPNTSKTTNSITVDASGAKDAEATSTNGKSEIKEIWYSNDDGTTWKINENKTQTTYTFNNLTQGQPYKIKVKVIDNAGNQTITEAKEETTGTVTSGLQEGAITFSINPTGWTNQDVTVTGTTNTSYTLQLSTSTTFPNNTNEVKSVTVSENQTVYARLIDSTMQYNGTASYKVDKIDKQKPVVGTLTPTPTSIRITATDEASGIIGYAVTTNTTQPTTFTTVNNTKTLDTTVTGKNQNTTYYVWVKDEAGNVSAYSTTKTTTQTVTSINVTPTSATLKPNQTVQLSANVQPNDAYNKTITWSTNNPNIVTVSNTGLVTAKAAGSVTIIATANDGSGKSGSATITVENNALNAQITAANYGDYVNYPVANGSTSKGHTTDWRIFYKDNDGYVYLISSYYLHENYLSNGGGLSSYSGTSRPYTAYWYYAPTDYTEIAQATYDRFKMNYKYNGNPNNGKFNMKCVSKLMNTSSWSKFVDTAYAVDAIGVPTLEMWVDSWNAKENTKLYYNNTSINGYYIGTSSRPTGTYIGGLTNMDTLYFPTTERLDWSGYDYWLASPNASYNSTGDSAIMCVLSYGAISGTLSFDDTMSVRPLVRLKNTVAAEKGADGVWNLK